MTVTRFWAEMEQEVTRVLKNTNVPGGEVLSMLNDATTCVHGRLDEISDTQKASASEDSGAKKAASTLMKRLKECVTTVLASQEKKIGAKLNDIIEMAAVIPDTLKLLNSWTDLIRTVRRSFGGQFDLTVTRSVPTPKPGPPAPAPDTGSGKQSRGKLCGSIDTGERRITELRAEGVPCQEAQRVAEVGWTVTDAPRGWRCEYREKSNDYRCTDRDAVITFEAIGGD